MASSYTKYFQRWNSYSRLHCCKKSIGLCGGIGSVWGSSSSTTDLLKQSLSVATTVYDSGRTLFDRSKVEDFSHSVEHNTAETYLWVGTQLRLGPELLSCTTFEHTQWKETAVKQQAAEGRSLKLTHSRACWLLNGAMWQVFGKAVSTGGESPCELHIEVHWKIWKWTSALPWGSAEVMQWVLIV